MSRLPRFLVGVMVAAFVLGMSAKADAAFIAAVCSTQFCTDASDVIVIDNGTGDLANATSGAIVIIGSVGGYDFVMDTSQSKPLIGSATQPQMDISYTLTNGTGTAGDIWLYATDTNFTGTVNLLANLDGNSSYSTFSIDASVWGGSSNTTFDLSSLLIALGPFTGNPYSGSGTAGPVGTTVNPYSLTLGLHFFSLAGILGSTATGDLLLTSTSVPEPASLLLLGAALLGGGAAVRRRRRRQTAA